MKNLMIALMLAFASIGYAGPVQFENKTQVMDAGSSGTITDSAPTYALNSATSTVVSSYIDLSATGMLFVCVTGTAGINSALIAVQFSNTNTAAAFGPSNTASVNSVQQLGIGCYPIKAAGRWLRFQNQSVSQTGSTVNKVSVNYYVVSQPGQAGSASTITGTVTAVQGSPGASPWPVASTKSASTISDFTMNAVTFASSVAGTSLQYLTLTSESYLFLGNDNTVPLYFVLTNSATAPTTTGTIRRSIPSGGLAITMKSPGGMAAGFNFLHWFWPASASATLTPTASLCY